MADTVADRRLHPSTLFIRFIRQVPEFVLGLPAFITFASSAGLGRFVAIAAAGAAAAFAVTLLTWMRFRYGVGERDIVIESGILNRQRRVIPFDRIQDIDIEQRFLARLFGAAKVRIETGGAAKDEGDLNAVTLQEAHRLRDVIRGRARAGTDECVSAEPEEPLLFRMDAPRLLIAGLFSFSLFYLAVIGGAFQYVQPWLEERTPDPDEWTRDIGRVDVDLDRIGGLEIYVTLALALIVLLLGVVTGVIRTVMRDWNFRLTRTPAGFRRRRGLLTLSEVVIPLRRVQLAMLGSGWVRRWLGWYDLHFQTLSADAHQSGHQSAAPFARIDEIRPILQEAGITELPEPQEFVRVSRRTVLRRYIAELLPAAIVAGIASIFFPLALLALIPLAIGAVLVVFGWRRHRYAFREHALYISEGVFRHRLWILPYEKAQTISVTRGPAQRKFGLATVAVDTAGASPFRYPQIRDVDAATAEVLAERLLGEYRRARGAVRAAAAGEQQWT